MKDGRDQVNALRSVAFLRQELPVRLAHMLKEFDSIPSRLTQTTPARQVRQWYIDSFTDLNNFIEKRSDSEKTLADFSNIIKVLTFVWFGSCIF
jgi:pyruvate dehydrogenase kinase 2/3/4